MKILIVDDDPHILRLYKEELKEEGYEVVTLDILMPDIDGKTLLRKMKEQRPQTPVIMSTAYDYMDDIKVWTSDSDAYVVKSSDLSELKRTIEKLIIGGKEEN